MRHVDIGKDQTLPVRVAMCQILCLDGDREGNFVRIEHVLARAQSAGAHIACFPESVVLGWVNPEAHRSAYAIPGADSDRIAELAQRYGLMIAVGMDEKDGDDLYDSVVLVDSDGRLLARHRKINHIAGIMDPPYASGSIEDIAAVDTRFGRIGLLICADTFEQPILAAMRSQGPQLVIVPYGWAKEPEFWPRHQEKLRDTVANAACAIGAPVIGTDLVGEITHGPWAGRIYGGGSVAADARGAIVAVGADRDVDTVIVELGVAVSGSRAP
jgi:predicted amidohydrolase